MQSVHLDTTQPQHLLYKAPHLDITVLGGIRLDGLDRLRVTLKVQAEHLALRHNLDLYNDTQVEKLIRKVAEKLEVGTSVTTAALNGLTEELEAYRLEELKHQDKEPERIRLSEEEAEAAKAYLSSPNLLERTQADIGKSGVIGEEQNRLLMYLLFSTRKREQPLHVVSFGSSGTGKTYLQEKVGELIPEEDKLEITSLSENSFYYFGKQQLQHKLLLIEDLDGAENALYPLRELQSKRRISKTVVHKNTKGETRTLHLHVEGPVAVAGCTTKESLYEDNANRSFLLYLDESKEQDAKIMQYQRALSAGKVNKEEEQEVKKLFKNCQRLLQPVKVVNPYAEYLALPSEVLKPRRTNAHYLAFIEAITFYHQYQRPQKADEQTGEIYIESTLEDIQAANRLLKEVLLRKSDELSGPCRTFFEKLKYWLQQQQQTTFTTAEARHALKENPSNQKRYMVQLQEGGYVQKSTGDKKHGYNYEVLSYEEYNTLKQGVTTVLDTILNQLQAVQSSQVVQPIIEPLKTAVAKQKRKVVHASEKREVKP